MKLDWIKSRPNEKKSLDVNTEEVASDKPSLRLQGLLQSSNNLIGLRKLQLTWWTLLYSTPQLSFFRNEKYVRKLEENVLFLILKHVEVSLTKWNTDSVNTGLLFMKSFLCYWPFSPSTRVTSKLFLRGFSGLRTTVSSGWAARRADFTSWALRPYTRQLLL